MYKILNTAAVTLFFLSLSGCTPMGGNSNLAEGQVSAGEISKISLEEAIRIAKNECERREFEYLESEIGALWRNGKWRIYLPSKSLTIGGDLKVVISSEGEILEVIGGK